MPNIPSWSERRVASALFVVALLLRVAWVVTLPNDLLWIDEREYADVARHMGHDAPGTVEELLERLSESMRLPALV